MSPALSQLTQLFLHHHLHHSLLTTNLRSRRNAVATEIIDPRRGVELGIHALDLALGIDVEVVDALDLLVVVARAGDGDPAPADGVAAVEGVERLQVEGWLGAG